MKCDSDKLYDSVLNSSSKNRNLFIFYLLFMAYILSIVGSTTDLMLLLPNSKVTLPILNVQISITLFYTITPFVIIIFYFNLLYNAKKHIHKFKEWKEDDTFNKLLIPPFILNFGSFETNFKGSYCINFLIYIAYMLSAFIIIIMILLRFEGYQNLYITLWHIATAIITIVIMYFYFFFKKLEYHIVLVIILSVIGLFYSLKQTPKISISENTNIYTPNMEQIKFLSQINNQSPKDNWEKSGVGLVLEGRSLKYVQLPNAFLIKANFKNAILIGANLQEANLEGAKFAKANLSKANLIGANLKNAEFIDLKLGEKYSNDWDEYNGTNKVLKTQQKKDVSDWDMSSVADLESAEFIRANLYKTNLIGANLKNAKFIGANLYKTNFIGAKLDNVKFMVVNSAGVDFRDAKLAGADFRSAKLAGVDFRSAKLDNAKFMGAKLAGVDFRDAKLAGADFRSANLKNAKFMGVNLTGVDFRDAKLAGVDFRDAKLAGVDFRSVKLDNAEFMGANLVGADFRGVKLDNAEFMGANLTGANFRDAKLAGADFKNAKLDNAKFMGANLAGADFRGTNLAGTDFRGTNLAGANLGFNDLSNVDFRYADLRTVVCMDRLDTISHIIYISNNYHKNNHFKDCKKFITIDDMKNYNLLDNIKTGALSKNEAKKIIKVLMYRNDNTQRNIPKNILDKWGITLNKRTSKN